MHEELATIAARIRELREIAGVSAESVAVQLGIPLEQYGQYEQGQCDIPIGILYQIATTFQTELTTLLTGDEPRLHMYSVVRKQKGIDVERRRGYAHQSLAFNFAHKKAEPFLVTVQPGLPDCQPSTNTHPGQEFNYVLKGTLKVVIGPHEIMLEEGDSLYFDASVPHGMAAMQDQPAQFLAIIF